MGPRGLGRGTGAMLSARARRKGLPSPHVPRIPGVLAPGAAVRVGELHARAARERASTRVHAAGDPGPSSSSREGGADAGAAQGSTLSPGPQEGGQGPQGPQGGQVQLGVLWRQFWAVAAPYWSSEDQGQARLRLAAVFLFTLGTTGVSVLFNFLNRDFYNAIESKNEEVFVQQLLWFLGATLGGVPVFVLRDYLRDTLSLRWRAWMTSDMLRRYMSGRMFYRIQAQMLVDNPDQRLNDDTRTFTTTSLFFSLALFNALIDLVSFSGILYSIYPPLFAVLIVYSLGGTAISIALGKDLVGLNFQQEKREADFRYGLVRVRENAESIAFYAGEGNEVQLLLSRFRASFGNYAQLLVVERNLHFFTSFYRYIIQLLPAAVVAPLFFRGEIEFGVISQSFSAFSHVLTDCSIIVYQFQSISAFSAIVERLGEFDEVLRKSEEAAAVEGQEGQEGIRVLDVRSEAEQPGGPGSAGTIPVPAAGQAPLLLELQGVTLLTPSLTSRLVQGLQLRVHQGQHLLIVGPSGVGKTSLLRAIAGLWSAGQGDVVRHVLLPPDSPQPALAPDTPANGAAQTSHASDAAAAPAAEARAGSESESESEGKMEGEGDAGGRIFFVPQRPYMVLGSLREQLLYPTWASAPTDLDAQHSAASAQAEGDEGSSGSEAEQAAGGLRMPSMSSELAALRPRRDSWQHNIAHRPPPGDEELLTVLATVRLGYLASRWGAGLDAEVEWASTLSLGEQQRIAFARLLLSRPLLALMDESTSALDEESEAALYEAVEAAGVTFISVAHRKSLIRFHMHVLALEPTTAQGDDAHVEGGAHVAGGAATVGWSVRPVTSAQPMPA